MSYVRCYFGKCIKTKKEYPNLTFFRFPTRDHALFEKWALRCNALEILSLPDSEQRLRFVCAHHFRNIYFVGDRKDMILPHAVPTLDGIPDGLELDDGSDEDESSDKSNIIPGRIVKRPGFRVEDDDNIERDNSQNENSIPDANIEVVNVNNASDENTTRKRTLLNGPNMSKKRPRMWQGEPDSDERPSTDESDDDQSSDESDIDKSADKSLPEDNDSDPIKLSDEAVPNAEVVTKLSAENDIHEDKFEQTEEVLGKHTNLKEHAALKRRHIKAIRKLAALRIKNEKLNEEYTKLKRTLQKKTCCCVGPAPSPKYELFNRIRRYLNVPLTALLRMDLFGHAGRKWKSDEKRAAIQLLQLGENVYRHFITKWRFRLPPLPQVQEWQEDQLDSHDDDNDDAGNGDEFDINF